MTEQQPEAQQTTGQPYTEGQAEELSYDAPRRSGRTTLGYVPPKSDLERDSSLNLAIPEWLVPAELKDQADTWNNLEDKLDSAEYELALARGAVANAPAKDKAARKAAIATGKTFTGTPEQDAAAEWLREAEANMRALNELSRETGKALIASLRRARPDVAHLTAERLTAAITAARHAADTARAAISTASDEVAEAAAGLTLIASLDANSIDFTGATIVDIPTPNLNPLLDKLRDLDSRVSAIDTPAKPELLRVEDTHGMIHDHITPASAKYMVEFGGREVPLYEGTSGLPEERKPVNGDSFQTGKKHR